MKKPIEICDTEIYPNYLLIGFKNKATGRVQSVEVVGENERMSKEDRKWLSSKMRSVSSRGFNYHGFDLAIIYGAIAGLTVRELKDVADDIIVGQMRTWDIEKDYNFEIPRDIDTVDVMEVAPGAGSLKIFNGRLHGRRMQDLPIEPSAILTDEEIEQVYEYWKNDLDATMLLHDSLHEQLSLREEMSREYGIDLRSKSDAQVAEAVIKKQVSKILGYMPKKPEATEKTKFHYRAPDFIRFTNKQLNEITDDIEDWVFRTGAGGKVLMPDFLSDTLIRIGNSAYSMGIGGLHSTEECIGHVADDTYFLRDIDVASYYPRIILNLGLFPKQLGKAFLKVYRAIVDRRLKAKDAEKRIAAEIKDLKEKIAAAGRNHAGPSLMEERLAELEEELHKQHVANEGGKIMINGSFGKLGSFWSALFSPDLLMTVTLTGQLSLLMLINRLEDAGISVVSGNTDGIVVKCRHDMEHVLKRIVDKWQEDTGFTTDSKDYAAIYSASVNNYFAFVKGGGVKRKGHYAKAGLEEKKNPTTEICSDAVAAFIEKGIPILDTIRQCRDIRKFVTVRNVNGGAIWNVKRVEYERFGKRGQRLKPGERYDAEEAVYLGKAIRWYYSTESESAIHYKTNHNKVPKSEGAKPMMQMPDEFPTDIDYSWYLRECRQIMLDIGYSRDLVGAKASRKKKSNA